RGAGFKHADPKFERAYLHQTGRFQHRGRRGRVRYQQAHGALDRQCQNGPLTTVAAHPERRTMKTAPLLAVLISAVTIAQVGAQTVAARSSATAAETEKTTKEKKDKIGRASCRERVKST